MHFDNLFFILLIAGAAILRWLAQQSKSGNKNSDREEPPPVSPEENETEEERVRRFFDALGQPPSSKPPPRITPRADIPPRPVAPVQPPPIGRPVFPSRRSTPAPREIKLPGQITAPPYEKRVFTPRVVPAPAFEIREPAAAPVELPSLIKTPAEAYAVATQAPEQVLEARTDLARRFRSTYDLRDIIVLREIFGPPRGLQDLATGRVRPDGGLVGSV
jgi:hypothetical protein